jgi:hypothetical protein
VAVLRAAQPLHVTPESFVFTTPTGLPLDTDRFVELRWHRALRATGTRPRKFYATRHTFISIALSRGCKPKWVAKYCGTSLEKLDKHYARWMGDDRGQLDHIWNSATSTNIRDPITRTHGSLRTHFFRVAGPIPSSRAICATVRYSGAVAGALVRVPLVEDRGVDGRRAFGRGMARPPLQRRWWRDLASFREVSRLRRSVGTVKIGAVGGFGRTCGTGLCCTFHERTTRMFLPNQTVPRQLVEEALALAQCAPSNSNIQP